MFKPEILFLCNRKVITSENSATSLLCHNIILSQLEPDATDINKSVLSKGGEL